LFEIDYLKHLQEHNFFNYNLKINWFFNVVSISSALSLSLIIILMTLYYNTPSFNENLSNSMFLQIIVFLMITLTLIILFSRLRINKLIKTIEDNFKSNHGKIKEKYKKLGVDLKSLKQK